MSVAAVAEEVLDVARFLERFGGSDERYELIQGEVHLMTGGRQAAFALSANLARVLGNHLQGGQCRAYGDGALVKIDEGSLLSPDLFVVCAPLEPDLAWFESPVLVGEVLSESTEGRDRGAKWRLYRKLRSLRHYLLISQVEWRIEHYAKIGDTWRYEDLTGAATLKVEALDLELPLAEIYGGIIAEDAQPDLSLDESQGR